MAAESRDLFHEGDDVIEIVVESSDDDLDENVRETVEPFIVRPSTSTTSNLLGMGGQFSLHRNVYSERNTFRDIFPFRQSLHVDRGSIRSLIREGKRLLTFAELNSRPEEFRTDAASVYKYNFSSNVTGCDLFRDREMAELLDVVTTLKNRLSAERVYSLGIPQLRSERDVFDELLMRFSDDLLNLGQGSESSLTVQSSDEASSSSHASGAVLEGHSTTLESELARSLNNMGASSLISSINSQNSSSLPVELNSDRNVDNLQSGHDQVGTVPHDHMGLSASKDLLLKNLSQAAMQEFFKNVNELKSLAVPGAELQSVSSRVVQAIQTSLSTLLGKCPTQSGNEKSSPRQPKRRRSEEESCDVVKKSKVKDNAEDKEEDSCTICMEPWSNGGEHRVTCLKCGHLFGLSCILKWVDQAHSCPQCKTPAKKSDLRHLFISKITAVDTSELDRAHRLLEEEKLARRVLEQKEATNCKKLEIAMVSVETLRTEVSQLKSQICDVEGLGRPRLGSTYPRTMLQSSGQSTSSPQFCRLQKITISQEGNCRVFDHCKELGMVVVSQKSQNTLFRGYGIKILTRDFKPLSYQPLHTAAIRDMSFRPGGYEGMLLSCGLDKSLLLTSVTSKVVIQKYTANSSIWCCAWNPQNTNLFYAGMERGVVKEFDIRRTDTHVQDVLDYGGSPISSIQYWSSQVDADNLQGLLIAQLQSLIFQEQSGHQFLTHRLPHMQAPLMSLSLHSSGKFLASFRPGNQLTKCRYEICKLCQTVEEDTSKTISTSCQAVWEGSNLQAVITRNCLITKPDTEDDLLAITANHSNNTVSVWDSSKRQELQTLPSFDKAFDIRPVSPSLLGVLTDKELLLYNWKS